MKLTVRRDDFRRDRTFGTWRYTDTDEHICESIERERDHNRASTKDRPGACIPAGRYLCRRVWSEAFDCEVFEVTGVPGRLLIRIHWANWSHQLRGCISTGFKRAIVDDQNPDTLDDSGVTSSRAAFNKLMGLLDGLDSFWLTVVDVVPEEA